MKLSLKKYIIAAGVIACAQPALAQHTYSGYFTDNYTYRFQMNPAFGNSKGFVSFPALGNLNLGTKGNLDLSDIFYNLDGKTVLFTNPGISEKKAMSNFSDRNHLGAHINENILSVGFKGFGGYNTISIDVLGNIEATIPKAFFSLAKEGVTNKKYDIKDMYANINGYAQIALNHSRDIKQVPGLRVGATLKAYLGVGNVDFKFNDAYLQLGENEWIAHTNADIYGSMKGLRFKYDYNHKTDTEYVSGADLDGGFGLNGFGMGLDLGAEYKWNDFKFSAAFLDLGFISWGKTQWASTDGTQEITTDSYIFNPDDSAYNSFDNEWNRFTDNLSRLYELKDMGELSSRAKMLGVTMNLGVEYEFPLYRRLNFGLLNSTRINGPYSWTEFRLSANVNPVNCISIGVNGAAGSYGASFGWMFNLYTTGFNLFAGMDHTIGKLSKEYIPLKSNNSLNIGINFPF